ncbi:MAG: T9SS type A sorting domain-containing protein [Sphingobacteriales bacterium]|nr:MAG: T9SS type A sorting domain-containing protein [Sphingobacteriales bacterium]
MMKKLCTTLLLLLAGITTFAQAAFAPVGAKWTYYKQTYWGGPSGIEKFITYTCDSSYLSEGRTIKIIRSETRQQQVTYDNFLHTYVFSNRTTEYKTDSLYEQNDTVFLYNRLFEKYTPLYLFNVQAGDTITLPAFDTVLADAGFSFSDFVTAFDSTFTFRVTGVDIVNYNGNALKTIFTEPVFEIDWSTYTLSEIHKTFKPVSNWGTGLSTSWLAHPNPGTNWPDSFKLYFPKGGYARTLGGLGAGLAPEHAIVHNSSVIVDGYFHTLTPMICYEDSTFGYFSPPPFSSQDNCDTFKINTPLSLKQVSVASNIKIYPNPALNILHIDFERPAKAMRVRIVNLLGTVVVRDAALKEQQNTIDLSALNTGLYLAVIETGGERYYYKFAKQ